MLREAQHRTVADEYDPLRYEEDLLVEAIGFIRDVVYANEDLKDKLGKADEEARRELDTAANDDELARAFANIILVGTLAVVDDIYGKLEDSVPVSNGHKGNSFREIFDGEDLIVLHARDIKIKALMILNGIRDEIRSREFNMMSTTREPVLTSEPFELKF